MNKLIIFNFLICLILCGCNAGGGAGTKAAGTTQDLPEWTIFIYGLADHNLTPSMLVDFQEMVAANVNKKVKIIVAMDLDDQRFGSTFGTQVYEVTGGGEAKLIQKYSEQNFDDPEVMKAHIVNAFSAYQSNKRGIILWDHGGSWDGGFGHDTQNGTVNGTGISVQSIKEVLLSAGNELGLGSTPFDFLSFDTCLMGNIESATELKDVAKYYFASAELDFGDGWDYTAAINLFSASPTSQIAQLAPAIVSSWDDHHKTKSQMDQNARTQVAIDLTKIDSFELQMSSFLANFQSTSLLEMAKALKRSGPGFGSGSESQSLVASQNYRDVGQFLSLLTNSSNNNLASESSLALSGVMNDLIKAQSLGDVRIGSQAGLSIESRTVSSWTTVRSEYQNLFWDSRTLWSSLLDDISVAALSDGLAPIISTTAQNTNNPSSVNKPKITFSTTDSDVDQAQLVLKRTMSGVDYDIGLVGYGFVENQNTYNFEWDGKFFTLSNGIETSLISLGLQGTPGLNSNGDTLAIGYQIKGIITNGSISSDAKIIGYESPLKSIVIIENGQETVMAISALSGAGFSFIPYLLKNQSPYFELMTPIQLTTGLTELNLDSMSAPAGTYKLETNLSDLWGNSSNDSDTVIVGTPF
jgi:hypothetical protein